MLWTGWLGCRAFISHIAGGWQSEILGSQYDSSFGSESTIFSLYPHVAVTEHSGPSFPCKFNNGASSHQLTRIQLAPEAHFWELELRANLGFVGGHPQSSFS